MYTRELGSKKIKREKKNMDPEKEIH